MPHAGHIVCLVPDKNQPGKHDMSGAFLPEANAFCELYGADPAISVRRFPAFRSYADRQAICEIAIASSAPLDTVALFCHGFRNGVQAGWLRSHVPQMAALLRDAMHSAAPRVILYACDTGRDADQYADDDRQPGPGGDGGFADALRDQCTRFGFPAVIIAHATAGHTTMNPYVRRFAAGDTNGGQWLIEPNSALWPKWVRAMRQGTLRFRMPFMSAAHIAQELTLDPVT